MSISFIVTDSGRISAVVGGRSYVVASDHPSYEEIKKCLVENDEKRFVSLADIPKSISNYTFGNVRVENGVVYYMNKPVNNVLTSRLLALMSDKFPFEPLLKFLDNLMQNPSSRAVKELYTFLSNRDLPITEDGCFLAYKRVNANWKDCHTGTIDNTIGKIVEVSRNTVDDNFGVECSEGLHVGSMKYVANYGNSPENHIVIVKINPRDVVSVPTNENATKCRVCRYEIMCEFTGILEKSLYNATAQEYHNDEGVRSPWDSSREVDDYEDTNDEDDDDDDWDDDDDDDDDDCEGCDCEDCDDCDTYDGYDSETEENNLRNN